MWVGTDCECVQLGPRDVHSCLSSRFRLSCSRDTAESVIAGLDTEAPIAGPPVVFTIFEQPKKLEKKTCKIDNVKLASFLTQTFFKFLFQRKHTHTRYNTAAQSVRRVKSLFLFTNANTHKSYTPILPWTDSRLNNCDKSLYWFIKYQQWHTWNSRPDKAPIHKLKTAYSLYVRTYADWKENLMNNIIFKSSQRFALLEKITVKNNNK